MHKIYYNLEDRDPVAKSENFWAHERIEDKPEYISFLRHRTELLELTDVQAADFVMIPYKWSNGHKDLQTKTFKEATANDKIIIAFYNDDYDREVIIPNDKVFLFRTSAYKSTIKQNEIIMPAFCEEFDFVEPTVKALKLSAISFCGNLNDPHRYHIFKALEENFHLCRNFLYRNGFWAPEVADKNIARKQFVENLLSGLFGICIRGNGNFFLSLIRNIGFRKNTNYNQF